MFVSPNLNAINSRCASQLSLFIAVSFLCKQLLSCQFEKQYFSVFCLLFYLLCIKVVAIVTFLCATGCCFFPALGAGCSTALLKLVRILRQKSFRLCLCLRNGFSVHIHTYLRCERACKELRMLRSVG